MAEQNGPREEGTVRWFNDTKGYGFITRDGGGKDAFVHYNDIRAEGYRRLLDGQRVSFEVVVNDKGPQAREVVILEPAST